MPDPTAGLFDDCMVLARALDPEQTRVSVHMLTTYPDARQYRADALGTQAGLIQVAYGATPAAALGALATLLAAQVAVDASRTVFGREMPGTGGVA